MTKPRSVDSFLEALQKFRTDRRKAENVLLDVVESEILEKEKFITSQIKSLEDMQENKNTFIENRSVLHVAQEVILRAYAEGA